MSGQSVAAIVNANTVHLKFPSAADQVLPGVAWGSVDAFPSPAYWRYQALVRRLEGHAWSHRIGSTLVEEAGACLLGGHGLPAAVGIAAFEALRVREVFERTTPQQEIEYILRTPLNVNNRSVHYRFARQKSIYLAELLERLHRGYPPTTSGKALRNWLLHSAGIGPKTASWVARNWLDADDVAILDIHILRAGALGGFLEPGLTVTRHYFELEEQFLAFSRALNIRPSELDAVIWLEMMNSGKTIARLIAPSSRARHARPHKRRTDTDQARLVD